MKRLIMLLMLFALALLFASDATAATKTWGTDVELGEAQLENVKIVGTGVGAYITIGSWGYTGWAKRREITVKGGTSALTNQPVKLTLSYDTDMKADFSDIRFGDSTNKVSLPYWIESKTDNLTADVWVAVPSIPVAGTKIYCYYGNTVATSESNEDATTIFKDDFNDYTTADVTEKGRWVVGKGTWTVTFDELAMTNPGSPMQANWIKANITLPDAYTIVTKIMNNNGGAQNTACVITHQDPAVVGSMMGVGMRPLAYAPDEYWVSQKCVNNSDSYGVNKIIDKTEMNQGVYYIVKVKVDRNSITLTEVRSLNGTLHYSDAPTNSVPVTLTFSNSIATAVQIAGPGSIGGLGAYDDFKIYTSVSPVTTTVSAIEEVNQ